MRGWKADVKSLRSAGSRRAVVRACLGLPTMALLRCAPGSDQATPELDIPAAYRASAATAAAEWPTEDWWTGFASPELNDLIEQARKQNFDIQAAIARVRQADAQVRIAGAALLPTLNGTGSAGWQHFGVSTDTTSARGGVGSNASADFRSYSIGLS